MTLQKISEAMARVEAVLQRKPERGLCDDAVASARWTGGARVVASHPNGMQCSTDLPTELGGTGDQVSPGWLFRAGIASCAATSIAMAAASAGIVLTAIDVSARSRSDTRGLLGMPGADGEMVYSGPGDMTLEVRVAADGVDAARLRAIVEAAVRQSPVPNAVMHATPMALRVEVAQE